jgi:Pyridine nucleotide-disulphide oxidoreductase
VKTRVVVLGAGFGGLELSTILSEELGESVDVTLIDRSDAFVFGYSKLDVMFGGRRSTPCGSRTGRSRSRASGSCRRRSLRSTRTRGESPPTEVSTTRTFSSLRSARTTTSLRLRA